MLKIGAAVCFLAVALGAFAAHALRAQLEANQTREVWRTAEIYQFLHGLAIIVLAYHQANRAITAFFIAGIVLFSGSLYVLAATGVRWLGAITPIGGLCFLAGWSWLFFAAKR